MAPLLGCIADDFTGATDLAGTLTHGGMRTVQMIGVPAAKTPPPDVEAIVVALKSRTIPAAEAIEQSLAALDWLRDAGCRQFFFKYCSTFDSTDAGNIGPVAEALLAALGSDFTIACPAFPRNGRTIFKGYLFAGDVLLNESGMQDHPLTPMNDPNLVRVLDRQSEGSVGLVPFDTVTQGAAQTLAAFDALQANRIRFAIVDALDDNNLMAIGEACAEMPLITGGSGIALGLPENFQKLGLIDANIDAAALPRIDGYAAVLSGSCSRASQEQVAIMAKTHPAFQIDPIALANGEAVVRDALTWAQPKLPTGPVLIYATADPEAVRQAQAKIGTAEAGALVEQAMAEIALGLIEAGVRRLIVAGGETAGAVVGVLDVPGLRIGPEIDPGVPWTASLGETELLLALKSGNFGAPDFFTKALDMLP